MLLCHCEILCHLMQTPASARAHITENRHRCGERSAVESAVLYKSLGFSATKTFECWLVGLRKSARSESYVSCLSSCFRRASHLASSSADSLRRYSSVFCSSSSCLSCCRRLLVSCTDADHSLVESCKSKLALVHCPICKLTTLSQHYLSA